MNGFKIDITGVINNMDFDKEKIKQYDGDFKKIATDLLRNNARISLEKVSLEQKNNNLQSKIDKANRILNANTHVENIYHALCNLFDEEYQYEIDNEELNKILKEDK